MSNNRLWITCKRCGDKILLSKYWDGVTPFDSIWTPESEMVAFLNTHVGCEGGHDLTNFQLKTDG